MLVERNYDMSQPSPMIIKELTNYEDDRGNKILFEGKNIKSSSSSPLGIVFHGGGNTLTVGKNIEFKRLSVIFRGSGAVCQIGNVGNVFGNSRRNFSASFDLGNNSKIIIGDNCTAVGMACSARQRGSTITIGNDCMFAMDIDIWAEDFHPIYDVSTKQKINRKAEVRIGNHVWVSKGAAILTGSNIGDGSVIGYRSLVKGRVPNNCVVTGMPGRVTKRDIAWERSDSNFNLHKGDSPWWALTSMYNVISSGDDTADEGLYNLNSTYNNEKFPTISTPYFLKQENLDNIGIKHRTDKSSNAHHSHDYLRKYEFFLKQFRNYEFTFLELGVLNGASLRTWEEYFPFVKIIGVDINEKALEYKTDRIDVVIGDLQDREFIKSLTRHLPSVIVDDASHFWDDQLRALFILYPAMPVGGVYIMEDTHSSFEPFSQKCQKESLVPPYSVLAKIAECITGNGKPAPTPPHTPLLPIQPIEWYKEEILQLAEITDAIVFIERSAILIKK